MQQALKQQYCFKRFNALSSGKSCSQGKAMLMNCRSPNLVYGHYEMTVHLTPTSVAIIWWQKIQQAKATAKLKFVQVWYNNKDLIITWAMSTSPSLTLEVLLDLQSLLIVVKKARSSASRKSIATRISLPTVCWKWESRHTCEREWRWATSKLVIGSYRNNKSNSKQIRNCSNGCPNFPKSRWCIIKASYFLASL